MVPVPDGSHDRRVGATARRRGAGLSRAILTSWMQSLAAVGRDKVAWARVAASAAVLAATLPDEGGRGVVRAKGRASLSQPPGPEVVRADSELRAGRNNAHLG
jgi:hypothetical protein